MDPPDYLIPQIVQEDSIYTGVEVYDPDYDDYGAAVETVGDDILAPNLRVSNNLFDSHTEDLLSIKIEQDEAIQAGECVVHNATDDESMAVEALRQLGNATYTGKSECSANLQCSPCDMEFTASSELGNHLDIGVPSHTPLICPICNEQFERKIDLNNHLVCHAVERPHSCRLCGTLFIHRQDLQQHMLTHGSNLSSNQCQICGQQFNRPSSLTNHMKIHNYQPGRALVAPKIEGNSELKDILTGNADPQMQPVQKFTLPSINNIQPMNSWNLNYEPESFNSEMNLQVGDVTINTTLEVTDEVEEESVDDPLIDKLVPALDVSSKKPYACTRCPKTFAREKALISHLNLHKDFLDKSYTCNRCEQSFNRVTLLDKHLKHCGVTEKKVERVRTMVEIIKTPIAEATAPKPRQPPSPTLMNDASFDINVYNKIYKHVCSECGKNFTTKQKLFRHMWIHRKKVFSCELCPKSFEQQHMLDAHRLGSHQSGSPYVCLECGKNFSSRQGLWEHNRIHTTDVNSFKCTQCSKTFSSRQGYLIHNRKHNNERPYGCRFCWKAFRDGGTLRKHERIHTGERPHVCPLCEKAFNQKVVLREHIRWLHTAPLSPSDDGQFVCSICTLGTSDKDELCAHYVKHSDQLAQLAKDASKNNISNNKLDKVEKIVPKVEVFSRDKYVADIQQEESTTRQIFVDSGVITEKINGANDVVIASGVECDLCGDVFANKAALSEHVVVHI